ncbi:glycosyltransferase [Cohnella caldifontis]|uniref:glycosyltransferase n=1 Tax=Cohnella caldifontis TaxID=3027471 RepID=UPI0023EB3DE2|nr:glycosyltransferase [Cohnella sp. YIM B05605]
MENRRVLFLITGLVHAGAEMQVLELAGGLRRRGWTVLVVSMTAPELDLAPYEKAGLSFRHLNMAKGVPDPRAIGRLRKLVLEFRPDVLHSHMVHANLLARVCRLFAPIPILVSTAHNTYQGGKLRMLMYRITDPLCELTTGVSMEVVESSIRRKASPEGKIVCVPNGVNLKRFRKQESDRADVRRELGLGAETFVWLAVGRLARAKDFPTLLQAWSRMADGPSGRCLLIAGQGDDREELLALADRLGVSGTVRFLGVRGDIPRLMGASDAYAMSSLWEGMPMVLLEASACELPIVATDVGGNREVVRDGESGYLVPPSDPDRLALAMERLMLRTEEERRDMGRRGREHVMGQYDIDAILSRWEGLYRDFYEAKRGARHGEWKEADGRS